ncbi:MAG TPA: hypothetical protein VFV33_07085 [Gemmatimonadaceae bacterium]|nr:hypothetical protein [Gemmatimonadaceae bacterium]
MLTLAAAASVVAVGASCIELGVDPKAIAAIEFVAPTTPAIVLGDTLRDTLGVVDRLHAKVFDAAGDLLPDAPLYFVTTDSYARVAAGSLLVANGDSLGSTKVYAVSGRLQSAARTLTLIRPPDSIAFARSTEDTIRVRVPSAGVSIDSSKTVAVTVRAAGNPVSAVRVRFELERRGALLGPADTATYALVTSGMRVTRIDTTDTNGEASRIIRVRVAAGAAVTDTLVVRATATMGGVLKDKPARRRILILPAP